MPWMIYFQQSAVVARRLQNPEQMAEERTGTLLGSVLTQMIMIGALVTLAASHTINKDGPCGGAWGGRSDCGRDWAACDLKLVTMILGEL